MHSTPLVHKLSATASLLLCLINPVASWQQEVHNQIGFMADVMMLGSTRLVINNILEPEYNGSLGKAAGWADTVRRTTHKYSYGWHFISAKDNPPEYCGLYYDRDCQAGGCVVQQIANQTEILQQCIVDLRNGNTGLNVTCSEALKFIAHFAGDVSQPLHTSDRSLGGNLVKVKFNGTDTILHSVWDKEILYAMTSNPKGPPGDTPDPYFTTNLISRIYTDSFRTPRSLWLGPGCDIPDARRGTFCPEQWAKDSNAVVCGYAYGKLVNGSDIWTGDGGKYARDAFPIIEEQIAKAAWRLAAWLDELVNRVFIQEDEQPRHYKLDQEAQVTDGRRGRKQRVFLNDQKIAADALEKNEANQVFENHEMQWEL